jgi:starch-binding outer membrane protein, SusD/RagB family
MWLRPAAFAVVAALLGACNDSFVPDFNNPTLPDVPRSAAELQQEATGIITGDREQHAFQILVQETMGRDVYRIDVADPRFLDMPLGGYSPGAFLVDFTWNVRYRTISAAQKLVRGIDAADFSEQEKAATRGFGRTMQANQYIALIETRDTLGVPIALGGGAIDPVRCKPEVLRYTSALLDSAAADLAAGGSALPFALSTGFTGFDTPPTFRTFTRALAAKVMTYRGFLDYAKTGTPDAAALDSALRLLDESFENHTDPTTLHVGVFHVYSSSSGDLLNFNFDQSVYRVNPKVLQDLEPGDRRAAKIIKEPSQLKSNAAGTVSSDLLFTIVNSPTAPEPIITNVELVLIRAEVLWGLGRDAEALQLVNYVRSADGGLGPVGPFANRLDLLRQILKQKRLSLLWESGSRVVDFRMFGLFNELGNEQIDPGNEPQVIPFPQAEIDARGGNLACQ